MKIVILDGYTANPGDLDWDEIAAQGELVVYERTVPDCVIARIADADVVYTNKVLINREVMTQCPSLKLISVLATGYNVVDTEAAKELGITVCNVPAYSTHDVAQMTMALLLEICHRVGHHSDSVRSGAWTRCQDFAYWDYPQIGLSGKTMGIVGFGRIGQAVARLAQAFGMTVLVTSRTTYPEAESEHCRFVPLSQLLSHSDVVSLHCPLVPETNGIINRAAISRMKDGAILLNTGRGPLLVEQDVADALERGKLSAAAMDVVEKEPIPADSPLLTAPNCFITPHIAWATLDARRRLIHASAENLRKFFARTPQNVVNP